MAILLLLIQEWYLSVTVGMCELRTGTSPGSVARISDYPNTEQTNKQSIYSSTSL